MIRASFLILLHGQVRNNMCDTQCAYLGRADGPHVVIEASKSRRGLLREFLFGDEIVSALSVALHSVVFADWHNYRDLNWLPNNDSSDQD